MDPITQGAVGAVAAKMGARPSRYFHATVIGALGGMAPDLDVLIRSSNDPLLALEFHRHFTHSLFFIPILGGLCGLFVYWLLGKRWQITLGQTLLWSILGYATHGLLDGCTSYGTRLLWPLSDKRFAWDTVSVIDPLFTVPLLIAIVLAVRRRSRGCLIAGVVWGVCYLGLGFIQHERAMAMGRELVAQRGHSAVRLEVKPSFANLVVWKLVYETEDRFYVDAVKPGLTGNVVWPGDSLAKIDINADYPWLDEDAQQRKDIQRFAFFSTDYIAVDPEFPLRIIDVRYSLLPHRIDALWGIELSPRKSGSDHVHYYTERGDSAAALKQLVAMILQ